MLHYLLFLPQIALLALYDWIFFTNDYSAFPMNCWWAFAFLHAALFVEFVSIYLLRHMKQMPLTKKHPMWLFTVVFGVQLLFAVVFSLVKTIKLNWVIILSSIVLVIELLSFGVLVIVQRHRDRRGYSAADEEEEDEGEQAEPELPPPPPKIKSSAMLILMKFLADPTNWDVPDDFGEISKLTDLASSSTQYTYAELSDIESELKDQTNALKIYIQNQSLDRAKSTVSMIAEILYEREEKIQEIENHAAARI